MKEKNEWLFQDVPAFSMQSTEWYPIPMIRLAKNGYWQGHKTDADSVSEPEGANSLRKEDRLQFGGLLRGY